MREHKLAARVGFTVSKSIVLDPADGARPRKSLAEARAGGFRDSAGSRWEPDYAFLARMRRAVAPPPQDTVRPDERGLSMRDWLEKRRREQDEAGWTPRPVEYGPPRLVWVFVQSRIPYHHGGSIGVAEADVLSAVDAETGEFIAEATGSLEERGLPREGDAGQPPTPPSTAPSLPTSRPGGPPDDRPSVS